MGPGSFMKACFVHGAAVWDEFILEDTVEERAKERSRLEMGEEGGCRWGWAADGLHGAGES